MIGDRIKARRMDLGLTQTELAKKLGVTRAAENAWEMGLSSPSVPYLAELSKVFGVSVDYLLDTQINQSIDISGLDEEEVKIVYQLVRLFQERKNSKK